MSLPRLLAVIGTRPEAIKVAPVVLASRASRAFDVSVVATGQHEELVHRALATFGLTADHELALGARLAGSQPELFSRLLPSLDELCDQLGPDLVLVQGDTASALAGAMTGVWRRVPVVHLEAGLRSFDVDNPFPEETYRTLIGDLASLHLAPTVTAEANLRREGIDPGAIVRTGNTVVDAARFVADGLGRGGAPSEGRRRVLVTVHRRENWGEPLVDVAEAIRTVVGQVDDVEVIVPVHPNPLVHDVVHAHLGDVDRVRLVAPLDHPELIGQVASASLVLTDSGGIQEEAPTFGTPVLVLRTTTERMEAVDAGCAELVGTDPAAIVDRATELLTDEVARRRMAKVANPFGDGRSGERAVEAMRWWVGAGARPDDWMVGEPTAGGRITDGPAMEAVP